VNFIGIDVHKEKLTVASIDENLNIEFIRNIAANDFKEVYKRLKKLVIPIVTSSQGLEGEKDISNLYEYINVDSVLWLKYFTPINSSPPIYNLIAGTSNDRFKVIITNDQNQNIEVELELLKNRKDGLKVCIEHKVKLAEFWGSHGDKNKYFISMI